jgi:son of sevenless-like protein
VKQKCKILNNFSTLTSIISALGTAPIARLKRTWDQVPQRIHATLETMRKLMASTKNFGEYREALHVANPPCIPFFGKPAFSPAELFTVDADCHVPQVFT